jgi:hypothetical protein
VDGRRSRRIGREFHDRLGKLTDAVAVYALRLIKQQEGTFGEEPEDPPPLDDKEVASKAILQARGSNDPNEIPQEFLRHIIDALNIEKDIERGRNPEITPGDEAVLDGIDRAREQNRREEQRRIEAERKRLQAQVQNQRR